MYNRYYLLINRDKKIHADGEENCYGIAAFFVHKDVLEVCHLSGSSRSLIWVGGVLGHRKFGELVGDSHPYEI